MTDQAPCKLSRRAALGAAAALPLAGLGAGVARAHDAPAPKPGLARSFQLGGFKLHCLLAGSGRNEDARGTFGVNVSEADFAATAAANFLPADWSGNNFVPVLVDTGSERVLFDTGLAPEALTLALAAAGFSPADVTTVVLTHMHGDHIGGMAAEDGTPTFPAARLITGRREFDHWSAQDNKGFKAKVQPQAERLSFLEPDQEAISGITAIEAFGHTPGHLAYRIESEGKALLLTADTANHFAFSLQHPDWEVRFDADKAAAAATRRRIFSMLAAERLPFIGYHMPFPALGHVETMGEGFRFIPHSYQLDPPPV